MQRLKNWLKNFGWVQTAIAAVAAVALVLLAGKARNKKKSVAKKEQKAADLMNSGISSKIHKGKLLTDSANDDKDKTVEIHKRMEARVEQLGEGNEDLDAIAHRFNSKRLRHQPADSGS